nr:uncharacterized protein LOC109191245 [Ipomoea batatas]
MEKRAPLNHVAARSRLLLSTNRGPRTLLLLRRSTLGTREMMPLLHRRKEEEDVAAVVLHRRAPSSLLLRRGESSSTGKQGMKSTVARHAEAVTASRPSFEGPPRSSITADIQERRGRRGRCQSSALPLPNRYLIVAFVVEGEAARRREERELVAAFLANWSPPLLCVVYGLDEGGMARERSYFIDEWGPVKALIVWGPCVDGDNGSESDVESDVESDGSDDFSESEYEMEGNISNIDDLEFDQNVVSTVEFGGVANEPVAGDEPFVNSWNNPRRRVRSKRQQPVEQVNNQRRRVRSKRQQPVENTTIDPNVEQVTNQRRRVTFEQPQPVENTTEPPVEQTADPSVYIPNPNVIPEQATLVTEPDDVQVESPLEGPDEGHEEPEDVQVEPDQFEIESPVEGHEEPDQVELERNEEPEQFQVAPPLSQKKKA